MGGEYILDTNIIVALFKRDRNVVNRFNAALETFIPATVIGELFYGAHKSSKAHENIERIERFLSDGTVLACDADTGRIYGALKDELRIKGTPIPENDIWIAALVRQHGFILVSRDAHFRAIDQLPIEAW